MTRSTLAAAQPKPDCEPSNECILRRFGDLKRNWPSGRMLNSHQSHANAVVGEDVAYLQRDHIAAAQFAVADKVEYGEIMRPIGNPQSRAHAQVCLGFKGHRQSGRCSKVHAVNGSLDRSV